MVLRVEGEIEYGWTLPCHKCGGDFQGMQQKPKAITPLEIHGRTEHDASSL